MGIAVCTCTDSGRRSWHAYRVFSVGIVGFYEGAWDMVFSLITSNCVDTLSGGHYIAVDRIV